MAGRFKKSGGISGKRARTPSAKARDEEEGKKAEERVDKELAKLYKKKWGHICFDNVIIPSDEKDRNTGLSKDTTNEIDHILVSVHGIFVIETKGWRKDWSRIYGTRTPVEQNEEHCRALWKFLNERDKSIRLPKDAFVSLVAWARKKEEMPRGAEYVHVDDIVRRINSDKKKRLSKYAVKFCAETLEPWEAAGDAARRHPRGSETKAKTEVRAETRPETDTGADAPPGFSSRVSEEKFARGKQRRKNIARAVPTALGVVLILGGYFYMKSVMKSPDTSVPPPLEATESAAETDPAAQKLREEFMRALEQYESEVEPKVAALRLPQWAAEMHAELAGFKTRALEQFTASEYAPALESLRLARAAAAAAEAAYARQLAELKAAATAAFENDRAEEAQQAVRRALEFKADDAEMRALQPRAAASAAGAGIAAAGRCGARRKPAGKGNSGAGKNSGVGSGARRAGRPVENAAGRVRAGALCRRAARRAPRAGRRRPARRKIAN